MIKLNKIYEYRQLIYTVLIACLIVFLNFWMADKEIVIQSPIQIRQKIISPVPEDWAEQKLRETIKELMEERCPTTTPGATRLIIDYEKVSTHSKAHPDVYGAVVRAFGDNSKVVGELLSRESGMNPLAVNITTGACGLFQAYPCSKLPCNLDDIECQLEWGKEYIEERYGSPENALLFQRRNGWY